MELENLENLINFTVTAKERFFLNQLSENATNCPNIDTQAVLLLSKQHFRCSVPKGLDLMGKSFDWQAECPCQPKISYFKGAGFINEQVLRFEISMNDSPGVAIVNSVAKLIKEEFDLIRSHG